MFPRRSSRPACRASPRACLFFCSRVFFCCGHFFHLPFPSLFYFYHALVWCIVDSVEKEFCTAVRVDDNVPRRRDRMVAFIQALSPVLSKARHASVVRRNETTIKPRIFFHETHNLLHKTSFFACFLVGCTRRPAASAGLGLSSSPFDGLAVAVSTVPLVLSSVFVLAELNRISGGGDGGSSSGETEGAGFTSKGYGEDIEESSSYSHSDNGGAAGSVCADGAELAGYLEVMLESSVLCAVWEVSSGVGCLGGRHTGGARGQFKATHLHVAEYQPYIRMGR